MTRDEAIIVLKNAAWLGSDAERDRTEQAVGIAVESLQADSVPVVHSEWVESNDVIIAGHCRFCGWNAIRGESDVVGMNFCPNCGAVMDGKNNALSHKPKSLLEAYMQMMERRDGNDGTD